MKSTDKRHLGSTESLSAVNGRFIGNRSAAPLSLAM